VNEEIPDIFASKRKKYYMQRKEKNCNYLENKNHQFKVLMLKEMEEELSYQISPLNNIQKINMIKKQRPPVLIK